MYESAPHAPIVVGVDGSEVSLEAVDGSVDVLTEEHAPTQARLLAESLAGWQEKYPDVPIRRVLLRGHPGRALVEASKGARLLVVGSRGLGGFRGLLLGSVSHAVLHHAQCPVVVIPAAVAQPEESSSAEPAAASQSRQPGLALG